MVVNIDEVRAQMMEQDQDSRGEPTEEEQAASEHNAYVSTWSSTQSGGVESHPIEEYVDDFHSMTFVVMDQNGEQRAVEVKVDRGMLVVRALDGSLAAMMTGATNIANIVIFSRAAQPIRK